MGTEPGRRRRTPRLRLTVEREGALWVAYDDVCAQGTGRTLRAALAAYARSVYDELQRYARLDAEGRLGAPERWQWEAYRAVFEAGRSDAWR